MKWLLSAMLLSACYGEAPPHGTLRGTVTDLAGKPIAGATVVVQSNDGEQGEITDENGTYVIDEIPAERVTVRIYFGNRKAEAYADIEENTTAHLETQMALPMPDEADLEGVCFSCTGNLENNYIIDP